MTSTLWLIVLAGALSIVYGIVTTRGLLAADAGTARMQEISAAVREGAAAYLKRQYKPSPSSAWSSSSSPGSCSASIRPSAS